MATRRKLDDALDYGRKLQSVHELQAIGSGAAADDIVSLLDVSEVDADAQPKKITLQQIVDTASIRIDDLDDVTITSVSNGQILTYNSASGAWVNTTSSSTVAGSNTQIQFNSSGTFGASADFTWNNSTKLLSVNGKVSFALGTAALPSLYPGTDTNTGIWSPAADTLAWSTNGSERVRIDSSGRLLVGTSSARTNIGSNQTANIQTESTVNGLGFFTAYNQNNAFGSVLAIAKSRGTTVGSNTIVQSGDQIGGVYFYGADGVDTALAGSIDCYVDGTPGANDMPGRLVFSTTADGASAPTERLRISQNAQMTYNFTSSNAFRLVNSTVGGKLGTIQIYNNGAFNAFGSLSFNIDSNGDVTNLNNSYGAISDIKLKENIVDASSQWDDIKALRPVNYNLKEGQTHTQLGLIAQEVELVSPGLVSESPDRDEDGNDLGTVTKSVNYSVLYMKAVKALQEAMERIETLEAKVAALESA